jgi:hypothetical protein
VDEKTVQRIKKLQALAERGVGGEKDTAAAMLQKMLEKNGLHSLEELETDEVEYFLFSYSGKHETTLLKQCMYKVIGAETGRAYYRTTGTRQKIGTYCTKAQRIEIELEFEFYRNCFYEEMETFMQAFIQKQGIFPSDAPHRNIDVRELTEDDIKRMAMQDAIKKRTRAAMIADKREGLQRE